MSKNARSRMWSRWLSRKPQAELPARSLAVETLEDRLAPATFTWSGAGANSLWTTATNWEGNVGPAQAPAGSILDLVFPSSAARPANQNDLPTNTVINQITIQGQPIIGGVPTPYTITQAPDPTVNSIILGNGSPSSGNFTVQPGSGSVTFGLPTTLATNGDQSISVGGSGSVLTISAALTGSTLNNLNKDGVGQLNLTTANPNLLGGVKVNNGILQIRNTLALGPAGGAETVVATGAGLYLNTVAAAPGQPTVGEQVRLNGGGFDPVKGALFLESGNAVWSGPVILETGIVSPPQAGGPGTVIGAAFDSINGVPFSLNITGVVSDSGAGMGLVKEGQGEVKLGSPIGNTYRGQTNVNDGILTATHSLSLGDSRPTSILNGFAPNDPRARPQPGNFNADTSSNAFQNPTAGTVVNRSPGRNGQLRIEAPLGGPDVRIVGEFLVLNNAGNDGNGALYNTRGTNTWAGSVVLGSSVPDGANVTIGVAPNPSATVLSSLTISGVVSDPQSPVVGGVLNPYSLTKQGGGRLILTNANTYRGTTTVNAGTITIRDSQGLGPVNGGNQTGTATTPAAPTGQTVVNTGGAVELDVEAAYADAVVPQYDDLGRDTWNDSVTNDAQRLSVREVLILNGRGVGASGTGVTPSQSATGTGTGALRNMTGINTWAAKITLASGEAAIGSELDGTRFNGIATTNRPGHPTPDSSYFRNDYSLTIQDPAASGTIGIVGARGTDFVKLGPGHLILPQANPYFGRTLIEQGWVTVQNNRSLGDVVPNTSFGKTAQQPTIVFAGASLHLAPTAPGAQLTILEDHIVLEGLGIGSNPGQEQHPYSFINQKGALVNLGGDNTIVGDVGLISTAYGTLSERGAGIGVERAAVVESPAASGNFVLLPSKLTITGDIDNGIRYHQTLSGSNGNPTSRVYDAGAGVITGRISVPFFPRAVGDSLRIYYPPRAAGGTLVYDSGGPVFGAAMATFNFSGASSQFEVVVNETGGQPATNPLTFWFAGIPTIASTPIGIVTQFPSSFVKLGSETLVMQGAGSFSGKKNEVREGTLLLQNDTSLGHATTGTETTQQSYPVTETVVADGATLVMAGSVAPQEGGVAAGVHVQDERLTLNEYGLQVRIAGQPTARFKLDFGGQQTDQLMVPTGFTGAGTYAQYLQDQINTKLTNIAAQLTAGVPGAVPADAAATVTELTPGVYAVTFGAPRFNNFDFSALSAVIVPVGTAFQEDPTRFVSSLSEVRLSGSNAPLIGLSDDNTWRGPVTLNSGTRVEVRPNSRLSLLGDVLEGAPALAPGSDLVKRDAGDLTLGGAASNYRGTTYIDEGIVTAVSSRAFGAASTGTSNPATGVTPGGTVVASGAQLQLQGSLTIAGEALAVAGNGSPTLPSLDSAIRWLNVGPGATNNGVAPPFTGPDPGAPTSGRIDSISTDPTDPRVIYVATAGGGAWKTKDGGLTWIPLFDLAVRSGSLLPMDAPTDVSNTGLPLSAMMFGGQIAVAPSNPSIVYYATGDANGEFNGIPVDGQTDNFAGSGVYKSTDGGVTWSRLLQPDGSNPLYGQAVTKMIVDPLNADRIYVSSGSVRTTPGTPTSVLNGSINAATQAGVWRFTTAESWVNLVAHTSQRRLSMVGQAPYDMAPPANPGPDDDYRIRFPTGAANSATESATWSDLQLVMRGVNPNTGAMQYTLYAALGESTQTYFFGAASQAIRNAIYRTDTPEMSIATPAAAGPTWWLGRGTLFPLETPPPRAYPPTNVDLRAGEFDVGVIPPPNPFDAPYAGKFGYIKIAAVSTADEVWVQVSPTTFLRTEHANVTLYVGGLWRDPYKVDGNGNPVPIDAQRGMFRELLKSRANTVSYTAGAVYDPPLAQPPTPFGTAVPDGVIVRPGTGRYDYTLALKDYNAQTLGDNDPNEVYIGGLDSLFRSTDGATTWTTVGPDAGGFTAAEQHHAIAFDIMNRLLVGTDGGLWRWDRVKYSNLNSNLPVIQFNSVDPHPTDFRQAAGGSASSGTQVWNGNTADGSTGVWARVDDLSTTPVVGQSGSVSGVVRYDPFNPNTIYAVRDGVLRRSDDGGRTWPFSFAFTANPPLTPTSAYNLFPLVVDPLTPNRILFGGFTLIGGLVTPILYESTNQGVTRVSLNAPVAPTVIALAGYQGAFVADTRFPTVTEGLSNTPDPRTIYISDGATIRVTKNRGVSWVQANFTLPADGTITDLVVNPVNRDEVYATVSIRPGGTGGRIWRSTDAGRTWVDLTGLYDPDAIASNVNGTNPDQGRLPNIPTWAVEIDPRSGTLYVGNDNGVWVLVDPNAPDPSNVARNATPTSVTPPATPPATPQAVYWRRVGDGMPNVQVRDLVLNQTTSVLTAGTYGRGMFQMFLPDYAANSGAVRAVSGQSRWTGPVVLTGNTTIGAVGTQQIQNGLSAASLDIGGTISSLDQGATPDFKLTKIGRGTLILSGANTYLGQTEVQEGVLEVKDPNALGAASATGNTVVRYGAALQVRSDIELEPITINGDGVAFSGHYTGALRNVSGNNTYNGTLTLGTETQTSPTQPADLEPNQVTIGVDSGSSLKIGSNPAGQNPTIIGHVQGQTAAMGLNKELPGILILASTNAADPTPDPVTGAARLAYLGLTQVYTGALEVRDGLALGPNGSQPTRVSDGAAVRIANNAPNTPTVVPFESLFLSGTGTPDGPGGNGTGALRNTGGNNSWNGPIQLTDIPNFAPTTNPGHQVAFGVTNPADVLSVGPAAGITEDFATYGQFGVIKVGTGVLRLTTANQYTGVTNVNEGTVRAANDQALGANVTSSDVQTIRVFGTGTYQLTVNGNPTANLTSNPAGASTTAAQMQAALENVIAGAAGNVLVSSTPNSNGNVYTVTFRGRFAGQNVPQLGSANVAPGVTVTIATPQEGGLGTVVAAGASLELDSVGLAGPVTVNETLTINGPGVTDPDGFRYGALGNRGGTNTYTGVVTFGSAASVGAQAGSDLVVSGRVLGQPNDPVPTAGPTSPATAELTKVGYGTVWFQGDKEFRGRTVVDQGALLINTSGGLGVGRNDVQRVRVTGVLNSELYTVTLFGETTDPILLQAGAAGATNLFNALTSPRSGGNGPILTAADLTVVADTTIPAPAGAEAGEAVFVVTFMGRLANTNVPLLTDISPSTPLSPAPISLPATTVLQGQPAGSGPGTSEIQTFTIPNQGGTFTLTGIGTSNFDVTLAALQAQFDAAFGAGNTNLTATVLPGNTGRLITIFYQGALANQNVAQVSGTFNPRLRVRVENIQDGVGRETQLVDVRGTAGLEYTLSYVNPFTGQLVNGTRRLGPNATAAEFQAALLNPYAASNGGLGMGDTFGYLGAGNVTVTRTTSPGGFLYLVQFAGAFGNVNVLPITTTIVNGGGTITVSTLQDGFEGTVVNPGGSLQTINLPAITSEWTTINGGGRSKVQTFTVTRSGAGSGTFTLERLDLATAATITGTRVLTIGDAAGTVASSTAAEFAAALTDPVALGGLGLGAGNVSVTRTDTPTGAVYTIVFTGALRDVPFSNIVGATATGISVFGINELEAGGGGALRMLDSTGNFTTVWGDPVTGSPLILGSNASIGVESPTDVLRLRLPTTDRNPYSAVPNQTPPVVPPVPPVPTSPYATISTPTDVRGPNQGFELSKVGRGTLEFNAAGDNDYTGATRVNDGTLLLNHTGAGSHDAVRGPLFVGDGIDFGGFGPAPAQSQSAVVRLANDNQIANAPAVAVNADGLLDLHGYVETIGNLTVTGGVVDTQTPTVPAFPAVPVGAGSAAGPELTTSTVVMNDGRFIVRGNDQAVTGTVTAANTAEVIVDPNARLTTGTIDLTASSVSVGDGSTLDTQGATITARRGATSPVTVPTRSTITTGTGATLTTVGATRGAVTLIDSDLTTGTNSVTQIGALTLSKDATLPATGSTAAFGTGSTLNTGGADVTVNESDLSTGTGALVNVPGPQGRLIATGTAADRSTVTFGANTDANFRSVALTLADLDVGAGATLDTTGTTAPDQGVTMTDATADFLANSALTTAAGGLTLTRSRLSGTTGVDINTQAVLLADSSTLSLGDGPSATLETNGQAITVNASSLITGDGAVVNPTNPAGTLAATGTATVRSVVNLGPNSTSTFASTTLDRADLTTGTGATLNAGPVTATNSTAVTGANSTTNTGSVTLTDSTLEFGANSTNAVAGNLITTDNAPLTATEGNVTFDAGSTTTVSGGVAATNAVVSLDANATVTAGPLALTNSLMQLNVGALARVTNVGLSEAAITIAPTAAVEASGLITVAGTANGSSTAGAGTLRLTGAAAQTVSVADGAANEDFVIGSGLTQTNGQTVVKAGAGRLTLAPAASGATLTTLLQVTAGDVQVNTLTGPVEVDAGATLSGNGTTGPITVPSGATVGTVSPGNGWGADRSGVLTADGDVSFGPTSTLFLNIIGNGTSGLGTQQPGTEYDQLFVDGNVTIAAGATLTGLVDTTSVRLSNRFVVVRATGTITGRFAEPFAAGAVFIDGYKFAVSYPVDPSTGDNLVVLDKVKANTFTTLSSSNAYSATSGSPSTRNQPVTFVATVSAEPGSRVPPPGTTFVQFFDDTGTGRTPIGTPVAISVGGQASITVSTLTSGTHTITADYIVDGDSDPSNDDFNQSTSTPPLTQIVEQPAVSVQTVTPVPAPISPNNSPGVQDALQLTAAVTQERAAYTPTITVRDSGGTIIYQQTLPAVSRVHPLNSSLISTSWNGTRNVGGGGFVPDGDYSVVVSIADEWGNTPSTGPVTVRVDNTNPTTTGAADSLVIKPGNATPPPPAQTVFDGTITDANPGTWTVTVTGPSGFVKSFGPFTGTVVNVTWDGTDASNNPVPDGRYTLTLTTTDAAGNTNSTTPVVRTVYVISTAPAVTLLSGLGTAVGPTTYGDDVTLTAVVTLPTFVQPGDVTTLLSGKPVTFDFPGTGTLTSNLVFNAALNRYEAKVVVPLDLPAGTYSPVVATFQPTAELPTGSATGSHTVNRAQLRVTGVNASRPYAELNPALTYTVNTADLKYSDTTAVVSGTPATGAVVSSNVGGYAITKGTVSALPNYDVVFTNGTLSVTPVPLTIRVNDATRARFGQNPPFTATFDGFKLSDGPSVVTNLNLVTDAQTNSPVGTYRIFSGTTPTATNYFPITVVPGTLTVTGSPNVTVVGSGEGSPAQAQVLSPAGDKLDNLPFDASFNGGVRTATGDFNKDGIADYVIGSGPGRPAFVQVIDGATGGTLFQAFPFEDFMGGTFVAAGDMTGDGIAELVVTPDEGGGPRVVIYRGGDFAPLVSYFAIDDANFRGGVRPAVGDINGDGFADLAVSAGFGGGPRISLWDGQKLGKLEFVNIIPDFFAFEDTLRNGAFVSVGDVNGDGLGDLLAGAGPGGGPRVKIYDARSLLSVGGGNATVFADFFAGNVNNRGGVKVAAKNLDGDRFIDVVTGGGKGDRAVATAYRGSALVSNSPVAMYEFDLDGTLNGVFVG